MGDSFCLHEILAIPLSAWILTIVENIIMNYLLFTSTRAYCPFSTGRVANLVG